MKIIRFAFSIIVLLAIARITYAQKGRNLKQEERNKKIVTDFYQEVFGDKNFEAVDKYLVEEYIQHNPLLADGRQTLKDNLARWFAGAPKETIDVQRIAAEGDLVFIHIKGKEGNKLISVIDIFRLINGKIIEHWDVMQVVPEKSANPHPMF